MSDGNRKLLLPILNFVYWEQEPHPATCCSIVVAIVLSVPEEPSRSVLEDRTRSVPKEPSRSVLKELTRSVPKEPSRSVPEEPTRLVRKEPSRSVLKEPI
nr:hypothetical protein [Tanacetum cinerariifolium]